MFVSEQEDTQQGEIWPFHGNPEWLVSNRWWNKKCKWIDQYSCNQRNVIYLSKAPTKLTCNILTKKRRKDKKKKSNSSEAEAEEVRKKQEAEIKNLKSSAKDFDARMSRADWMLQSACGSMEEGNKRMTKGLAEKNLDEIETAQIIIQLAWEKQQKAQDELKIVYKEKRKSKLGEKTTKKLKV